MKRRRSTSSAIAWTALLCVAWVSIASGASADQTSALLPTDPEARQAMAVAASAFPPDQVTTDVTRLAGEYSFGNGFDLNCTLVISPDGRFVYQLCSCDTVVDKVSGRVLLQNGYLKLQPEEPRTKWPQGIASVMNPVTWGQRVYLIPQDDYLGFSNQVNRGVEPVSHGSMGHYLLREGDWDRPVQGKPSLPPEWQERLLEKPVTGTVAGKDPSDRWIISLGKDHGVYDGMELSAWSPDLRRFVTIIVIETGQDTSAVQIASPPLDQSIQGWTVYSRVAPPGQEKQDP